MSVIAEAKPTKGFEEMDKLDVDAHLPKAIWMPKIKRFNFSGETAAKRATFSSIARLTTVGEQTPIESKNS